MDDGFFRIRYKNLELSVEEILGETKLSRAKKIKTVSCGERSERSRLRGTTYTVCIDGMFMTGVETNGTDSSSIQRQ